MQLEFFFLRKKKPTRAVRRHAAGKESLQYDEEMTQECVGLLTELRLDKLVKSVRVIWNHRMRTTAGRAFWPEARIEMNPKLEQIAHRKSGRRCCMSWRIWLPMSVPEDGGSAHTARSGSKHVPIWVFRVRGRRIRCHSGLCALILRLPARS